MVRFLSLSGRDQPNLGELDFHSWPVTFCSVAIQVIDWLYASAEAPRMAVGSSWVGWVDLPMDTFGNSTIALSLLQAACIDWPQRVPVNP